MDWVWHQSGMPVADETIEIHKSGRTGKNALEKLTARPTFEGEVKAGQEYILVDDAIAQGGTISELRHFVDNAGAKAVNVSTLPPWPASYRLQLSWLWLI